MSTPAPDSISGDQLKELLKSTAKLPSVKFDEDCPCELGILMGLLVKGIEYDDAPTQAHIAHAILCLVGTLNVMVAREASNAAVQVASPADGARVVSLTATATTLSFMESGAKRIIRDLASRYQVDFDGSVSDKFLESVGLTHAEIESFKQECKIVSD